MIPNRIIIFDLDGVLVDTAEMASAYMTEKYRGLTREMATEMLVGNFHEAVANLKLTHPDTANSEEEKAARFTAYAAKKATALLFPGILELLNHLKEKGYTMVINTSAVERACLPLLEKLDVLKFFDFVATAEVSKNKTEKFKIIEERYGASKESMVFITDTLGDVREAKLAGVRTIAVTWGAHDRSHFMRETNENQIAIVDTVKELEQVIETY